MGQASVRAEGDAQTQQGGEGEMDGGQPAPGLGAEEEAVDPTGQAHGSAPEEQEYRNERGGTPGRPVASVA